MTQAWFSVRNIRTGKVAVVGMLAPETVDGDALATKLDHVLEYDHGMKDLEVTFLTVGDGLSYEHVSVDSVAHSMSIERLARA